MDKTLKVENELSHFDFGELQVSSVSRLPSHSKKLFESQKYPNKVIRIERPEDIINKHNNKYELTELIEVARGLFKELEDRYGISVPADFFVDKGPDGNQAALSTVDKIIGKRLDEVEKTAQARDDVERLYNSVARYFLDKYSEGGLYLWDICGPSQYIYGTKAEESENKVYLIDTDIWLNNSRKGIYLVVYWLTRHISTMEIYFDTKFVEARKIIQDLTQKPMPEGVEQNEMVNLYAIKKFLNNEVSDYNPESAIPKFE